MAENRDESSHVEDEGSSSYSREEELEHEEEPERVRLSGNAWQELIGAPQPRGTSVPPAPVEERELSAPLKARVVAFVDVFNETSFSVFKFWQSMPATRFAFSQELRQAIYDIHELLHSSGEIIDRQYQESSRYVESDFGVGDGKLSSATDLIYSIV